MKLKYIETPLNNGGSAVAGCGTIHRTEIKATLDELSIVLGLGLDNINLNDYMLGSTGKREYSGDVDLVLDTAWYKNTPGAFADSLRVVFGQDNVARNGAMVHLRFPIVGYDATLTEVGPRTGFVQIDFNIADAAWERIYHYSPGPASEYKGAHRNLAIAAVTAVVDIKKSDERDAQDRPVSSFRWKWGSNGFIRVHRTSQKDSRSGVWMKKQIDTPLEEPIRDLDKIAKILFTVDGQASDLESFETIMAAIKRNFYSVGQESIYARIARNFSDWKGGKDFLYPSEIDKYFPKDDK